MINGHRDRSGMLRQRSYKIEKINKCKEDRFDVPKALSQLEFRANQATSAPYMSRDVPEMRLNVRAKAGETKVTEQQQ